MRAVNPAEQLCGVQMGAQLIPGGAERVAHQFQTISIATAPSRLRFTGHCSPARCSTVRC